MLALAVFGPRGRRILQETPFSVLLARSLGASLARSSEKIRIGLHGSAAVPALTR